MEGWRKGYLYQCTDDGWIELDPREHGDKYMAALSDLLEKAPNGAFNNLFCMNLIAQKAFVKYLQALEITLSELTENGRTKRGSIKSQNYSPGVSGFKIDYDGDCEFNNGNFRGHIEADSGVLNNIAILENALFQGNISSGPLVVSAQAADDTPLKSYSAGTVPYTIYNEAAALFEFDPSVQTKRSFAITGTFNGKSINFIEFWLRNGVQYPLLEITVFFEAGGSEVVARHFQGGGVVYPPFNLQASLSYRKAIFVGKTLRLLNIPTTKQATGSGILWRDGDTLKIS